MKFLVLKNKGLKDQSEVSYKPKNFLKFYRQDIEKQERGGVVAHERLTESRATME